MNKILFIVITTLFSLMLYPAMGNELSQMGFYSPPEAIIEKLKNNNGYKDHFMLADAYSRTGEKKTAILHYANSCFMFTRNPDLKTFPFPVYEFLSGIHFKTPYYNDAVYQTALLFYEYREFEYVIKLIDLVTDSEKALYRDAVILKAKVLIELKDYDKAVSCLKKIFPAYKDINSKSLILIRIASAYERKENYKDAFQEYLKIISLDPASWHSGIACDRILYILSSNNFILNETDKHLLIKSLYLNKKFQDVITLSQDIIKSGPRIEQDIETAEFIIISLLKTKKIRAADDIIKSFKNNENNFYSELVNLKAGVLWSSGEKEKAVNIFKTLIRTNNDDISKNALNKIILFLYSEDKPNFKEFIDIYLNKYPADTASEKFLWLLAKESLISGDTQRSLDLINKSLSSFPEGAGSGKNRFWLYKLYSRAGKDREAMEQIMSMVMLNPDSPYTWTVLDRIKNEISPEDLTMKFEEAVKSGNQAEAVFCHTLLLMHEKDDRKRNDRLDSLDFTGYIQKFRTFEELLEYPASSPESDFVLKDIEKYFAVGYIEGINREISLIQEEDNFVKELFSTLSYYGEKYGNYYIAHSSAKSLMQHYKLNENIPFLSARALKRLYPAAYADYFKISSCADKIETETFLSIMKAESAFNHRAVSSAGAVGLMQIMPRTGKDLARKLDIKNFDLRDPLISIRFGMVYLNWLKTLFNGNFNNMTAAYNSGPGNIRKWKKKYNVEDEDLFVEHIPYDETVKYVLKTRKYQILYRLLLNSSGFYQE